MRNTVKPYLLPAGIILYWICYGTFYPEFYSIQDERAYLAKAYSLSQGYLFPDNADTGAAWIDRYPPGQALLLCGLLKISYHSIYLLNPVFLTLIAFVLATLLEENGAPRYFAVLALFHPAMLLFSRTLMSDIPAAFFFLLAVWLLLYRHDLLVLGAFALGFTISLRVALVPFAGLGILYILWQQKEFHSRVKIFAGFVLGVVPFFYYMYQSDFFSAYAVSDVPRISLWNFFPHVGIYLLGLNLIYPFLFILGVIPRYKEDLFLKTTCVVALLFFPFFGRHPFDDLITALIIDQRFFLFTISPLLIGYALFLKRTLITTEIRFLAVLVILVVGSFAASLLHQEALKQNKALNSIIYENTTAGSLLVTDDSVEELILDIFGERKVLNTGERNVEQSKGQALHEIFQQINAFGSEKIFLVYLDRGGEKWREGDAILAHYRSKEVASYRGGWHSEILRTLFAFTANHYHSGHLRVFQILPERADEPQNSDPPGENAPHI